MLRGDLMTTEYCTSLSGVLVQVLASQFPTVMSGHSGTVVIHLPPTFEVSGSIPKPYVIAS